MNTQRIGGLVGLFIGLAMTLAANLAYAVPKGPVVIGVGLCCPLVLPLALWIRSTLPKATRWWEHARREIPILLVAGPAAAISYAHCYSLLLEHDPRWQTIAILAPLSADGLAALSTLALSASTTSPAARGVRRGRRPGSPDPAPQRKRPRPETARDEGASPLAEAMVATASGLAEIALQAKLAERVAGWLAEHRGRTGQPETIAQETEAAQARFPGVSAMTIRRARKILDQRAVS